MEVNYLDNRVAALPLHFGGRFIFAALPANPALGLSEAISAVQAVEQGLPAAYIQGYGNPQMPFGQSDVSVFIQDDWRLGRLVIKPGVRYQKQFWPEASYDVSNIGGTRLRYDVRQGGSIAPRLAAAYDLNGDGDGGAFPSDRARRHPADAGTSVGRNSETMPAQLTLDARVARRFAVRGRTAVEVIAEAFNLFNRSNFSEVNNIFGSGPFPSAPARDTQGRVTYGVFEQALPPRQIQLALRFIF